MLIHALGRTIGEISKVEGGAPAERMAWIPSEPKNGSNFRYQIMFPYVSRSVFGRWVYWGETRCAGGRMTDCTAAEWKRRTGG